MHSPGPRVSRLGDRDRASAVAAAADAFTGAAPYDALLPGGHERAVRHTVAFLLEQAQDRGVVEVTRDESGVIDGVAAWIAPGAWPVPLHSEATRLPHLMRTARAAGVSALVRLIRFDHALAGAHPSEPHWYLATLGVRRDRQGHGQGSALLRHRLAEADSDRTPVFLETQAQPNVDYYRRFGFDLFGEAMPVLGVTSWPMVRRPAG